MMKLKAKGFTLIEVIISMFIMVTALQLFSLLFGWGFEMVYDGIGYSSYTGEMGVACSKVYEIVKPSDIVSVSGDAKTATITTNAIVKTLSYNSTDKFLYLNGVKSVKLDSATFSLVGKEFTATFNPLDEYNKANVVVIVNVK